MEMLLKTQELSQLRNEQNKSLVTRVANKKVKVKSFPKGSLVLRCVEGPHRIPEEGKLTATWEGPFTVTVNIRNRAYKLSSIDGKPIP